MRAAPVVLGAALGVLLALVLVSPRRPACSGPQPPPPRPPRLSGSSGSVLCVLLTSSARYWQAAQATWATHCDHLHLANDTNAEHHHRQGHTNKGGPKSSFHILCDLIRRVGSSYPQVDWVLFVKDDMFVIPENLRYLVAPLNASRGYYLGHSINFWGVDYNVASAGFVLSRAAIKRLVKRFPSTEACISGGKYWKQEDLYLGKHLRAMNIFPSDTRDDKSNTLFFSYDLDKIMFPNSMHQFANFYTRAIYPVKCCGRNTITFQVLSSTEIYRFYYMIYTLRVYPDVSGKTLEPPISKSDDYVWQDFLIERGLPFNVTNKEYERSWYLKIGNSSAFLGPPKASTGGVMDNFNLTNMPDLLAGVSRTSYRKAPRNS